MSDVKDAAFRDGLKAAAEYLLACDDYGDRHKAEEIRNLQPPASTPAEALPSQTSGAEAGAWQTVRDFVDEMLRDWPGGDDCRMGFGFNGATVTKGQFRAVRSALASLSPAATPVSEAGGEAAERSWRRTKFEFIGAMRQALINSGLTREQVIIADNAITEAFSDLAKPASSPAPVRPIGNQGISDYQREIARNMAEGFAAWNAARQEALPSDDPASSPAGGDVVKLRAALQLAKDMFIANNLSLPHTFEVIDSALSSSAGPAEPVPAHEGWRYGEMIYNALYAEKGGLWHAVSDHDKETVWYQAGYRFAELYAHPAPATVEMPTRAWMRRWAYDDVDVMTLKKADRPKGWGYFAVTVDKLLPDDVPLAALAPATEGRKS